jgi:hypothetical protein
MRWKLDTTILHHILFLLQATIIDHRRGRIEKDQTTRVMLKDNALNIIA